MRHQGIRKTSSCSA